MLKTVYHDLKSIFIEDNDVIFKINKADSISYHLKVINERNGERHYYLPKDQIDNFSKNLLFKGKGNIIKAAEFLFVNTDYIRRISFHSYKNYLSIDFLEPIRREDIYFSNFKDFLNIVVDKIPHTIDIKEANLKKLLSEEDYLKYIIKRKL